MGNETSKGRRLSAAVPKDPTEAKHAADQKRSRRISVTAYHKDIKLSDPELNESVQKSNSIAGPAPKRLSIPLERSSSGTGSVEDNSNSTNTSLTSQSSTFDLNLQRRSAPIVSSVPASTDTTEISIVETPQPASTEGRMLVAVIGALEDPVLLGPTTHAPKNIISRLLSLSASDMQPSSIDEIIAMLLNPKIGLQSGSFFVKPQDVTAICQKASQIFMGQPALLRLEGPIKVVGDTHGQFRDLLRIFDLCGHPPKSSYLFLGDYVDRGKQSLETILLLFCYKIKYPDKVFLTRGNHECANVNKIYGFYDECKRRSTVKVWKSFTDAFNCLPLAAVVSDKIFCVHGGLSPALTKLTDISGILRPTEIPESGILNDLLWSDPSSTTDEWDDNDRGVSVIFGVKAIDKFLNRFDFDLICRAHMVVEDGYEFFGDRRLVTIFSAPNYCGEFDNCAAVMNIGPDLTCSFEILRPSTYRGKLRTDAK